MSLARICFRLCFLYNTLGEGLICCVFCCFSFSFFCLIVLLISAYCVWPELLQVTIYAGCMSFVLLRFVVSPVWACLGNVSGSQLFLCLFRCCIIFFTCVTIHICCYCVWPHFCRWRSMPVAWVLCCCGSLFRLFGHAWMLFRAHNFFFVCLVASLIFFCLCCNAHLLLLCLTAFCRWRSMPVAWVFGGYCFTFAFCLIVCMLCAGLASCSVCLLLVFLIFLQNKSGHDAGKFPGHPGPQIMFAHVPPCPPHLVLLLLYTIEPMRIHIHPYLVICILFM